MKRRAFLTSAGAIVAASATPVAAEHPAGERAQAGDPIQRETSPPSSTEDAINRRNIRQAIITKVLVDAAAEIIKSGATLSAYRADGTLKQRGTLRSLYAKEPQRFVKFMQLIADPERAFNDARDHLYPWWRTQPGATPTARDFGSINLVVFRNAMRIPATGDPDLEEIAQRVVIRAGVSGGYRGSGFLGCK